MKFSNKNVFITGGSRGIGKAIAIKLAREGANLAIAAKTVEPDPRLEGTLFTAAEEIANAGTGKVLPLQLDIRYEVNAAEAIQEAAEYLGGIDILVNNASAISLTGIEATSPKRYDLMQDVNVRGSFFVSQACIPYLKKGNNPHILFLSPRPDMDPRWFGRHLAYTLSKYGMSMVMMGLAAELAPFGIASNAIWPRTTIATAAVKNILGGDALIQRSRRPEIVADAAAVLLEQPSATCTGNFFSDEELLAGAGITDFSGYAVNPGEELMDDLFL